MKVTKAKGLMSCSRGSLRTGTSVWPARSGTKNGCVYLFHRCSSSQQRGLDHGSLRIAGISEARWPDTSARLFRGDAQRARNEAGRKVPRAPDRQ